MKHQRVRALAVNEQPCLTARDHSVVPEYEYVFIREVSDNATDFKLMKLAILND